LIRHREETCHGAVHLCAISCAFRYESAVPEAILDGLAPTREEPGCLSSHAFRSIRDARLFYVHSRWKDESAFARHAGLPHTVRFLERVEPLIDHPLDVTRSEQIG
jgi:quinol monooxygenase YgiN